MSASANTREAPFAGPVLSVMVDIKSTPKDVVEGSIGDDVVEKNVSARFSDPKTYRREEVWLTFGQFDEVQNAFRAVSQKHEEDLLESLQAKKYPYSARLMTLGSLYFGKSVAVNVDTVLEHCVKERLFKEKFCSMVSSVVPPVAHSKFCYVWTADHRVGFGAHTDKTCLSL